MTSKFLTVKETASYLRISVPNLYKIVAQDEIPHIRLNDRILFDKETLDQFMKTKEQQAFIY